MSGAATPGQCRPAATGPSTTRSGLTSSICACGLSDTHIIKRRQEVERLEAFLGHSPLTATLAELQRWARALPRNTPQSRYTAISHVRSFYGWCVEYEHLSSDPARRLPHPKLPRIWHRDLPRLAGHPRRTGTTRARLAADHRRVRRLQPTAGGRRGEDAGPHGLRRRPLPLREQRFHTTPAPTAAAAGPELAVHSATDAAGRDVPARPRSAPAHPARAGPTPPSSP